MNELPTTFGKYYLTEKLATGGMAEIYLAKILGPAGFEKQLVIKQIHPRLSGQRQFVDMFVAEAIADHEQHRLRPSEGAGKTAK